MTECMCDPEGSASLQCDSNAECECNSDLITGANCDMCEIGYFGFPNCTGKSLLSLFMTIAKYFSHLSLLM